MAAVKLPLSIAFALCVGCATEQPAWITKGPNAVCISSIDATCLSDLIEQSLSKEQPSLELDNAALRLIAVARASDVDPVASITSPSSMEQAEFEDARKAYEAAGDAIKASLEGGAPEAVKAAIEITNLDASNFALLTIISLSDGSMHDDALGQALSALSERDQQAYYRGLHGRLVGLLLKGDLERANALRNYLVKQYIKTESGTFMPISQIAATYAMAGLTGDAKDTIRLAGTLSPDLNTPDNLLLYSIAMKAAIGDYPPPQDFYLLSSDQSRLDAYLLLSTMYRRTGNSEMATRSLSEAVRFAQKSSFSIPASKALEQIATSTLGVL